MLKQLLIILVATLSSAFNVCAHADGAKRMLAVVEEGASRVGFYQPQSGKSLGGVYVGYVPHEMAITKDGQTAYISNFGIKDYDSGIGVPGASISVVDIPNRTEKYRLYTFDSSAHKKYTQIDGAPHGIRLRPPMENQLYVNVEKGSKLLVFDLSSNTIIKQIPVNPNTHNFVFSPDGTALWLMAGLDGVIRMDAETGKITGKVKLASSIRGLDFSPDGRYLIASAVNEVILIDPVTATIFKRFDNLGVGQIFYSALTPDGRYLLAPAALDNQVLVIEEATGRIVKRIVTGLNPIRVIVGASGQYAYVSNASDKHVTKIDLTTLDYKNLFTQSGPNDITFVDYKPKNKRNTLILGVPLPLSGKDGPKGRDLMRGYEYWRALVQRKGGLYLQNQSLNVKIIYLDTQSDQANIEALTNELLTQHRVNILLSTYGQPAYDIQKQIAQKNRIPITPPLSPEKPWQPGEIASGEDFFITSNAYDRQYYVQYNVKATSLAAAASALGIVLQQTLLMPMSNYDYENITTKLAQGPFKVFYQY